MSYETFNEVCQHVTHITGEAMTILVYLAVRADNNNQCFPKKKTISEDLNISLTSVKKILRRLELGGVVQTKIGRGAGNPSTYTVIPQGKPIEDKGSTSQPHLKGELQAPFIEKRGNFGTNKRGNFETIEKTEKGELRHTPYKDEYQLIRNEQLNERREVIVTTTGRQAPSPENSPSRSLGIDKSQEEIARAICEVTRFDFDDLSAVQLANLKAATTRLVEIETGLSVSEIAVQVRRRFAPGTWGFKRAPHIPQVVEFWQRQGDETAVPDAPLSRAAILAAERASTVSRSELLAQWKLANPTAH